MSHVTDDETKNEFQSKRVDIVFLAQIGWLNFIIIIIFWTFLFSKLIVTISFNF